MSEWVEVLLKDLSVYGEERISMEHINSSNYISTENMNPNRQGVTVASSLPSSKTIPKYSHGDILISNIRPYFKKIWFADNVGGCSNDVLIIRNKNEEQVDSKYLYYCLFTDRFFNYVMSGAKGAKMPRGDKEEIMKFPIYLPPIEEQRVIAKFFSNLDKKIELNNQMNQTLEHMAMTLYKHWFVDFGPFQDGEFVETELGLIPKEWKVISIGDVAEVKGGKRLPKGKVVQESPTPYRYIRVKDFTERGIDINSVLYIDEESHLKTERYIITSDDLYISIAGTIGLIGFVPKILSGAHLTENAARITNLSPKISKEFLYCFFSSKIGSNQINFNTLGSTQPKLPLYGIKGIKIILPPKEIMNDFMKNVRGMFELSETNFVSNVNLKEIRDYLLPKLLSGEIDLSNAEKEVEKVL